ncbi:hypothetical protein GCM10011515_00520 [Tsuneonella deserti]|uniref:histidine kinase n=1 Tax=Tsuneonella deserti TaxID=2035528 RepID=A0ABQ1RW34_9SPHN|nr:hypothetical protein GCM10011515_00520 [Tsuneonella deserti]
MKKLQRALVTLVFLAVPLALVGMFVLVQQEFQQTRSLRASVEQSAAARRYLVEVLSQHQDIESGQRGFVLTGDRAFLQPYDDGRARARLLLASSPSLSERAPALALDLRRLHDLSRAKIAFADKTVALVENGDLAGARGMIAAGEGKRLMDALRTTIATLGSREEAHLAQLTSARDHNRMILERTINLTLGALALILTALTYVIWRTLRHRQVAILRVKGLSDRHRAILNSAVDGMMVLDEMGTIREANPSVSRLFGYRSDDLVGMHNTALMANPPTLEDSNAWLRSLDSTGVGFGGRQDFIGRRADGTTLATDVSVARFDDDGRPCYVAVVRDVTERKRIEQMKTEFVSTVSHELRTPLTSIGGSLGLLAAGAAGPLGDKAARLVSIAHSNCERLVRLINDILDIEKIESGKMQFDRRRMSLGPLVERTVGANAAFGDAHAVRMHTHMPPWPIAVLGDPDRLEQLLTNLLSNAIKHSPEGGTVDVRVEAAGGTARIDVSDRGAGVPADFRHRIFRKFAMADSSDSRGRGGTGLGLAISREIAERHDGSISFIDREGGGTTFSVELPMADCLDVASGPDQDSQLPVLLHLDDDHDCLSVIASAFAGRASVVSVSSVSEAKRAIAAKTFAGVIVDVVVPPLSGLDLVPDLRSAAPGLPIVVFTALDDAPQAAEVDAVLVKGRTSFSTLVETMMALVGRAAREAA